MQCWWIFDFETNYIFIYSELEVSLLSSESPVFTEIISGSSSCASIIFSFCHHSKILKFRFQCALPICFIFLRLL
jgi:hypothetical protein